MHDYNDTVVEIQYVGDGNVIVSGNTYQLTFYDKVLLYLQPLTSLVIVSTRSSTTKSTIQDLNSLDLFISNFSFN